MSSAAEYPPKTTAAEYPPKTGAAVCPPEKCRSCFACVDVCPKNCVSTKENERGERRPEIDASRCVDCGACRRVCPVNSPVEARRPLKTFAAWSLDEADRESSASGGVASVLAARIVANGGVVYSTAWRDGALRCVRVDSPSGLPALKGSKYACSSTIGAYRAAKRDLESGRTVLLIGTPCQVAGFRNFFGDKRDNLYLVEIICHGTPPQALFLRYLREIGQADADAIRFRTPRGYFLECEKNGRTTYRKGLYVCSPDPYYAGFMSGLFFNRNCYDCVYASVNRVGDATLGDFWKLGARKPFSRSQRGGVSLVLPTTERGLRLIESCSDALFLEERDLEEAVAGQTQLRGPAEKRPETDRFFDAIRTTTIADAVARCDGERLRRFRLAGLRRKIPFYAFAKKLAKTLKRLLRRTSK